jgi:hypothetical protein
MPPAVMPLKGRIPVDHTAGHFPLVAREPLHIEVDGGRWVVCVPADPKAHHVEGART